MSNVEFILTVNRDPQARQRLAQWERDLIDSQIRVEQRRLGIVTRSETAIAAARYRGSQQAIAAQNREYQRMLQQQMAAYQAFLQRQVAAYNAAQRQMIPAASGGAGGGGAVGGGGGLGGMATGAMLARGLRGGIAGLTAGGIVRAGGDAIQSYADLQTQQIQLGILTGSTGAASKLTTELKKVGQAFGITLQELSATSKLMIGFGVQTSDTSDKLRRFAAITGGNADAMNRLGRAYGQAKGLGKLMAEETNQFIDAGFSPLIAIADKTGESIGEVRARMKEGGVGFEELRQSIESATESGGRFNGMMEAMEKSVNAAIGRNRAMWTEARQEAGKWLTQSSLFKVGREAWGLAAVGTKQLFQTDPSQFQAQDVEMGKKYKDWGLGGLGSSYSDKIKAYELSLEQEKIAKRINDATNKKAEQEKKANEEQKQAAQSRLSFASQEIIYAQELNKLRIESSKKELESRKEILEAAKKATTEARKNLMSAQERFGSLTEQEQQGAISTLMKARRSGVSNLSLDEINKLKSIGSDESERLAGAALRNRASAAFNVDTGGLSSIVRRRESIDDEITRLRHLQGKPKVRKEAQDQIRELQYEKMQLAGSESTARSRIQENMGVRDSLFSEERRAVVESRRQEMRIQAGVKQQIEFVAHFENTSQEIAERVGMLMQEATRQQSEEVIKLLKPLMKQAQAQKYRIEAQNPGGR